MVSGLSGCTNTNVTTPSRLVQQQIDSVTKDVGRGTIDAARLTAAFGQPDQIVTNKAGDTAYWIYDDAATTEKGWSLLLVFSCSLKSQNSGRLVAQVSVADQKVHNIWSGTTSFLPNPK